MKSRTYLKELLKIVFPVCSPRKDINYCLLFFLFMNFIILLSAAEEGGVGKGDLEKSKVSKEKKSEPIQTEISEETALMLVRGDIKRVADQMKDSASGKDLRRLYRINRLVLDYYKDKVGTEITLPVNGKTQKGVLTKIKGSTLYFKIKKPKITTTWPLKVKKLPIGFKMKLIDIPDYIQNLYFGAKEFKKKNYAAAKYFLVKTGSWTKNILDAADKESKYIMALAGACVKGDNTEIKALIIKGADVNGDIVAYIKEKGASVESRHVSTPLIESIKCLKPEVVKLLVKNGADVNKSNSKGVTPLMFAIMYFPSNMDVLNFLLDHGALIDAVDKSGNTPLCGAVAAGRPGAVKLLLKRGAEINAPNKRGLTPVMVAVISNRSSIFNLLVEKGADLEKRHSDGWNIFDLDRSRMDSDIRKCLDRISPAKERKTNSGFPGLSGVRVKTKEQDGE